MLIKALLNKGSAAGESSQSCRCETREIGDNKHRLLIGTEVVLELSLRRAKRQRKVDDKAGSKVANSNTEEERWQDSLFTRMKYLFAA